jgi:Phycobilisome degradation protein nblA
MNADSFKLTLEQEFHMKLMEQASYNLNHDQMRDLLLQVSQQLMIKDNVIRDLVKQTLLAV